MWRSEIGATGPPPMKGRPAEAYSRMVRMSPSSCPPSVLALAKPIFSLQFITSQGVMALFIGLIAKELWEALVLSHGALSGRHRRIMPLGAVLGAALGAGRAVDLRAGAFATTLLAAGFPDVLAATLPAGLADGFTEDLADGLGADFTPGLLAD